MQEPMENLLCWFMDGDAGEDKEDSLPITSGLIYRVSEYARAKLIHYKDIEDCLVSSFVIHVSAFLYH